MITIAAGAHEELFTFRVAGLGGPDLALGLLFGVLEVFGGEAAADVGSDCLLALGQVEVVDFRVVATC